MTKAMTKRPMEYLRECRNISMRERPFSLTDAMFLCNVTYIDLKGLVPEDGSLVTLGQIDRIMDKKRVFSNPQYGSMYLEMFELMKDSERYGTMQMGYFREVVDRSEEMQFGAMTFFLETGQLFVGFRGTDGSWLGWKEDFNYAYRETMPSQTLGLEYLYEVAASTSQDMYVGGHSKGGTIAVYAASSADEAVQDRILKVLSIDGIGFRKGFFEQPGFKRIEEKVFKVVPEESLIGRIFEIEPNYRIVRSFETGMVQHDFMNWMIEDDDLVYLDEFPKKKNKGSVKFNNWLKKLTDEQIRNFVETLFEVIGAARVEYIDSLFIEPKKYIKPLLKKLFSINGKRRRSFYLTVLKYLTARGR